MQHYEVVNYKTGKIYHMVKATDIDASTEQFENIRRICNEPLVLKLFKDLDEYPLEKAKSFVEWAGKGWNSDLYYVFLIVDKDTNLVVAAIDIKSNNPDAEIGYWCSKSHSGLISNALKVLVTFAKEKGHRSLYAKPINDRSTNVLVRNGFSTKSGEKEQTFEKLLELPT